MLIDSNTRDMNVKIHDIVYKIMLDLDLSPENYNWQTIVDYIQEREALKIKPYRFEQVSSELISGMIVKTPKKIGIYYNSNMVQGRQNFTICHEMIHALMHLDNSLPFQHMYDKKNSNLSDEEETIEFEADFGGSILMLPDIAIVQCMKTTMSFPKMAEKYEMTQSALYVRLTNFLLFTCQVNKDIARKTVNSFRYEGSKTNFCLFLNGYGSKIEKEIIYSYENA